MVVDDLNDDRELGKHEGEALEERNKSKKERRKKVPEFVRDFFGPPMDLGMTLPWPSTDPFA